METEMDKSIAGSRVGLFTPLQSTDCNRRTSSFHGLMVKDYVLLGRNTPVTPLCLLKR